MDLVAELFEPQLGLGSGNSSASQNDVLCGDFAKSVVLGSMRLDFVLINYNICVITLSVNDLLGFTHKDSPASCLADRD